VQAAGSLLDSPAHNPHLLVPLREAWRVEDEGGGVEGQGGGDGGSGEGQGGRGCIRRKQFWREQFRWSRPDAEGEGQQVLGADSLQPRAYHTATFVEALGCTVVFGGFAQVIVVGLGVSGGAFRVWGLRWRA